MVKIICPKNCGASADTEERLGEEAMLDYWMDNDGKFHWTCFECGEEWLGNFKGEKI